jgi:hypothetical protein
MKLLGGQKQFGDGEDFMMSNTDGDACSKTDKLPNHSNDLLNKIWKTMKETDRKEDKERLEELIKQMTKDAEKMKESLFKKCEDRANKLAADISNLERKTQQSTVEINNKIQSVEEVQCQRVGSQG